MLEATLGGKALFWLTDSESSISFGREGMAEHSSSHHGLAENQERTKLGYSCSDVFSDLCLPKRSHSPPTFFCFTDTIQL